MNRHERRKGSALRDKALRELRTKIMRGVYCPCGGLLKMAPAVDTRNLRVRPVEGGGTRRVWVGDVEHPVAAVCPKCRMRFTPDGPVRPADYGNDDDDGLEAVDAVVCDTPLRPSIDGQKTN